MIKAIKKKRSRKGFTLIELVVVVAILGILAAVAIPRLTTSRKAAEVSAHNANVRTIEGAAAMYLADGDGDAYTDIDSLIPTYLNAVPVMPKSVQTALNKTTYACTVDDDGLIEVDPGLVELNDEKAIVLVTPVTPVTP